MMMAKISSHIAPFFMDKVVALGGVLAFVILVAVGVHGFSTGMWDAVVPEQNASYRFPHRGDSLPIRSDEWLVSTPFKLMQCASADFFPCYNERVNNGADMFIATPCNPVWDWTAVGQFSNWGYFLFGAKRGLAWDWWSRYLLLPVFVFLYFSLVKRAGPLLSLTTAVAMVLAAPTQWWDTTVPYQLVYFFSSLVFLYGLVTGKVAVRLCCMFGMTVSMASFFFSFYTPFQFLLLPVWIILGVDILRKGTRRKLVAVLLAVVGLVLLSEILYFLIVHWDTLMRIKDSVYPGHRISLGGSLDFIRQCALYDILSCLSPFWGPPGSNVCADHLGLQAPVQPAI